MELKKYICCDYENKELFGKECTIVDKDTYYEYYVINVEGEEYTIYKSQVCKNKIDILNHIIFLLSDYSELYISNTKVMQELYTNNDVEITLNKDELKSCNNFKQLFKLAVKMVKDLYKDYSEEWKELKELWQDLKEYTELKELHSYINKYLNTEIKEDNKIINKTRILKTNDFIIYKYNTVYRVHFFTDENYNTKELKSFITRDINKIIKRLNKQGYNIKLEDIETNKTINKDINIKEVELNEIVKYCNNLLTDLNKTVDESINKQSIKSFCKDKNNINEFLNDNNYIKYKDFIMDQLDYNLRYL